MKAVVLGAAAGGGFPQWNSNAEACRRARAGDVKAMARTQASLAVSGDGERWHRSVYLDETAREVTVFFDDMTARGPTSRRRPNLSDVRHVLFVVDTVNTRPGTSGQIWIDDVRYGR